MPRKGQVPRREAIPDPKFDSVMVTRFVNALMSAGKRSTAERAFYDAMKIIETKAGQDPMAILKQAMTNVKPVLEVKSRRVGGANYQVPREVRRNRQQSLAIRWLVDNARKKKGKPMAKRLSEELADAYQGTGASVQWKENVHKMAEANKAYSHYAN